jgi:tetratricopeptide (TPR) repeat protein
MRVSAMSSDCTPARVRPVLPMVPRARGPWPTARGLVSILISMLILGWVWPAPALAQAPTQAGVDQDDSALLVEDARKRMARGDYARAGRSLDRALALNPRRIDIYVLRASVHAALAQYPAGIALLRRAQSLAPNNPDVLTTLGSQLLLAGHTDEGVPLLEQVVARFSTRYDAHILLGYHHAKNGAPRRAITAFESYFRTRPERLRDEDTTHRLGLADAYLRAGDSKKARQLFRAVLRAEPRNLTARLGLAWATAAIDCRQALPLLAALDDLTGRYPDIDVVRGHCELAIGKPAEAESHARRYLDRNPRSASAHALLGEARLASGDLAGARTSLRASRRLDPGLRHVALRLARLERDAGDPAAALALLDEIGPARGDAAGDLAWSIERAEALLAAGRADEAAAQLGPAIAVAPAGDTALAEACEVLGVALYRSGDTAGAVIQLERALAGRPASKRGRATLADALALVGAAQIRAGELAPAEATFERASEVLPGPRTWRNLGIVRLARDRAGEAIAPLARAASAGDVVALHLHARALGQAGQIAEARRVFAAAGRAQRDPAGRITVTMDLAAMELAGGDPERAVAALEDIEKLASDDPTARAALVTARYAAGLAALRSGAAATAVKLLEAAEAQARGEELGGIRCYLVLATLLQGERRKATARLATLQRADATCVFREDVRRVTMTVLEAVGHGLAERRARREIARLESLYRRSSGPARDVVATAVRVLATSAALSAYSSGRLSDAERYLASAARVEKPELSPETRHNQAVLDIARDRNVPAAMAALEDLSARLPEALVNLGVASDRRGEPRQALDFYERARERRVRFAPLAEWIAAKRRVLATEASGAQP